MIDVKLLASAHERVTYQLEHANIHIDGVGNEHIAVLLDAAKVYQSAVVSKDAVSAACDQYWIEWDVAHRALRRRDYETIGECMARCLTAAKIQTARRVNTDTLAGFDGGYDAGWQEAIEAAIITVNDHRNAHPVMAEIAQKLAALMDRN